MRCPHLTTDNLCAIYDHRPQICRDYAADEVCRMIEAPTLEERVSKYLALFQLEGEAAAVRRSGCQSMRLARGAQAPVRTDSTTGASAGAGSSGSGAFFGKTK